MTDVRKSPGESKWKEDCNDSLVSCTSGRLSNQAKTSARIDRPSILVKVAVDGPS